jgi:hypothetical protein
MNSLPHHEQRLPNPLAAVRQMVRAGILVVEHKKEQLKPENYKMNAGSNAANMGKDTDFSGYKLLKRTR